MKTGNCESETKVFQFIAVSNVITDKIFTASWCCQKHRQAISQLIISMNESVMQAVKKHGVTDLPQSRIGEIELYLNTLAEIEATIDKMNLGQTITMPHGGIS